MRQTPIEIYEEIENMNRQPTHPGVVLKMDIMKPLGLPIALAADKLGVDRQKLNRVLTGKSRLTADLAVKIGLATNTSPESWMNMQSKYDLYQAMQNKHNVESFLLDIHSTLNQYLD